MESVMLKNKKASAAIVFGSLTVEMVGSCPVAFTTTTCGYSLYNLTESPNSCDRDSPGCGNTICEPMENEVLCPEDCFVELCGNGVKDLRMQSLQRAGRFT